MVTKVSEKASVMRIGPSFAAMAIVFLVCVPASVNLSTAAGQGGTPAQDAELLRFASRAASWYPDSNFKITADTRWHTPSGSYRVVEIDRACANERLSGGFTIVVDEVSKTAWVGTAAVLPEQAANIDPMQLRGFLDAFLPSAIEANMRQRVRLDWQGVSASGGALLGFGLMVDTGYGEYRREAAATADGRLVVMGSALPLGQDPVAYRRDLLRSSDLVIWDHPGTNPKVEIVEFSDLECPGCRNKWDLIKKGLDTYGDAVKHGMVGFPLPAIHPWAFRAACATWCLAAQKPALVLPFKELFYSLQKEMEVSLVTPTSVDFVVGNGLGEEAFRACYLREESLSAVHGQLALGNRLGVAATPTYVINGWIVQMPDESWLMPMIERLSAGREP